MHPCYQTISYIENYGKVLENAQVQYTRLKADDEKNAKFVARNVI